MGISLRLIHQNHLFIMNKALTLIVALALTLFEGVKTQQKVESCPDTGCTEQGGSCVDIRRANLTDFSIFPLNAVDLGNKIGDSTLCKGISSKVCCDCYKRVESSCIDQGCGKLWDGKGECVNMTAADYSDLKDKYDLSQDTEEIMNDFTLCQSTGGDEEECCRCLKSGNYAPFGPQTYVSETTVLDGGWTLCHSEYYATEVTDYSIETSQGYCNKDKIMMACRYYGASELTSLAWADRATVFGVTDYQACGTYSSDDCYGNVVQGTKWYRTSEGYSYGAWGFADSQSPIRLYYIDWDSEQGNKRISWNVNYSGVGGYRCGDSHGLDYAWDWEKVFYHRD